MSLKKFPLHIRYPKVCDNIGNHVQRWTHLSFFWHSCAHIHFDTGCLISTPFTGVCPRFRPYPPEILLQKQTTRQAPFTIGKLVSTLPTVTYGAHSAHEVNVDEKPTCQCACVFKIRSHFPNARAGKAEDVIGWRLAQWTAELFSEFESTGKRVGDQSRPTKNEQKMETKLTNVKAKRKRIDTQTRCLFRP